MHRASEWRRPWYAATLLALGVWGCGSGGSGGGSGLSGTITTDRFSIPAGETRTVTGDLVVKSTGEIDIAGTLLVDAGKSVALLADGDVIVSGAIKSSPAKSVRSRDGDTPTVLLGGVNAPINGQVEVASDVLIFTRTAAGIVTINGKIVAGDGREGTHKLENGETGHPVEVGSARANAAGVALGSTSDKPARVVLNGHVKAGDGGDGFTDPGSQQGNAIIIGSTNGGEGGSVQVAAEEIEVGGTILGGTGGRGGAASAFTRDGRSSGEKGQSVAASSGSGGAGGDLTLSGAITVRQITEVKPGDGGNAGRIDAAPGTGGPGGNGGDGSYIVGNPGEKGEGYRAVQAKEGTPAEVLLSRADGGAANAPGLAGGNGGALTFSGRDGKPVQVEASSTIFGLNGGRGFDGCSVLPAINGTGGGRGGSVTGFPKPADSAALSGGDGGDGKTQGGAGGGRGVRDGVPAGQLGNQGPICPPWTPKTVTGTGYLAVRLDHDMGVLLKAGDVVPLYRLRGGHIGSPEPITTQNGCDSDHYHGSGVFIRTYRKINKTPEWWRWIEYGPREDPDSAHCGYGKLVIVQSPDIQTSDPEIK